METSKTIGKIFSDYETKTSIKQAEIEEMNLIKKTNTLELSIKDKEYIDIKEIWFFKKQISI